MTQVFYRSTNTFARATIFGGFLVLAALLWMWAALIRSPYSTAVSVVRQQPVPFSHEHHVSGLGIDCRYCHTSVEKSAFAGIPATEICMGCHSQIWTDAPVLEPVRVSYRTSQPIRWTRVHDLPDFVYFNHAIHVNKGIGCESCHGPVNQMPLVRQQASLLMEWCLNCHRNPASNVRRPEDIFKFGSDVRPVSHTEAHQLVEHYGIDLSSRLTDCWVCHR